MVGVVAAQTAPAIAGCLDEWYFASDTIAEERNAEILSVMVNYQEFDPQAFLLAYLENVCGEFERN